MCCRCGLCSDSVQNRAEENAEGWDDAPQKKRICLFGSGELISQKSDCMWCFVVFPLVVQRRERNSQTLLGLELACVGGGGVICVCFLVIKRRNPALIFFPCLAPVCHLSSLFNFRFVQGPFFFHWSSKRKGYLPRLLIFYLEVFFFVHSFLDLLTRAPPCVPPPSFV